MPSGNLDGIAPFPAMLAGGAAVVDANITPVVVMSLKPFADEASIDVSIEMTELKELALLCSEEIAPAPEVGVDERRGVLEVCPMPPAPIV